MELETRLRALAVDSAPPVLAGGDVRYRRVDTPIGEMLLATRPGGELLASTFVAADGREELVLARLGRAVSPRVLRVKPGRTAAYRVTFTRTSAAFDEYAFGSLTWTNGRHKVRSQLVVQPVGAAAPDEVDGTGPSGSAAIRVTPGVVKRIEPM